MVVAVIEAGEGLGAAARLMRLAPITDADAAGFNEVSPCYLFLVAF